MNFWTESQVFDLFCADLFSDFIKIGFVSHHSIEIRSLKILLLDEKYIGKQDQLICSWVFWRDFVDLMSKCKKRFFSLI
jgi:hypothetical protein